MVFENKLSPPHLAKNSISQERPCQLFGSNVSAKVDLFHVIFPILIPLSVPSFDSMLHVFTKDMKRLIADLESADDGAAVVRRYEGALAVRLEVGCGF